MTKAATLALLQSARIAELKRGTALVQPRPLVELPHDKMRRYGRLLALLAAERRRSAALVKELGDG